MIEEIGREEARKDTKRFSDATFCAFWWPLLDCMIEEIGREEARRGFS
jgi:hypothetical protein